MAANNEGGAKRVPVKATSAQTSRTGSPSARIDDAEKLLPAASAPTRPYILTQLLADLGSSETNLAPRAVSRIKKTLPVPVEQEILWADVSFGTRTHGLVLTDAGIFFKDGPSVDDDEDDDPTDDGGIVRTLGLDRLKSAVKRATAQEPDVPDAEAGSGAQPPATDSFELDGIGYHYLRWENFDPARVSHREGHPTLDGNEFVDSSTFRHVAMACVRINNRRVKARNAGRRAVRSTPLADPAHPVRTVCRSSAAATVNWCFDEEGSYKFILPDGSPAILEVALDQYDAVLQRMRKKLAAGAVPGVSDPDAVGALVRCGGFTYLQAVNVAKTGRIPCASYNERTGSVVCKEMRGLGWWIERWLQLRMRLGAGTLDLSDERAALVADAVADGLATGAQAQALATKDPEALKREQAARAIGGNAVSTAGYALGSTGARVLLGGLGAVAGPLGMIAGMALGDACGKASVEAFDMARDLIFEPERRVMGRLLGGVVANVAFEHALTRTETALLNELLGNADPQILQMLGAVLHETDNQEVEIRRFLAPLVAAIRKA